MFTRRFLLTILLGFLALAARAQVVPGIEVLEQRGFIGLRGKRVGLVTNPSGVDRNLRSTIDILFDAPGVDLVALFGPEHGVRGDAYAGDHVSDAKDPRTGPFEPAVSAPPLSSLPSVAVSFGPHGSVGPW